MVKINYSNFELAWLNSLFYKKCIFKKEDILFLLQNLNINVNPSDTQEELEVILITCSDISYNKLILYTQKLMQSSYSYLLSYEEAQKIYKNLLDLNINKLLKIYFDLSKNKSIISILKRGHCEFRKDEILYFILEALYKIPKEIAKQKLKKYLL